MSIKMEVELIAKNGWLHVICLNWELVIVIHSPKESVRKICPSVMRHQVWTLRHLEKWEDFYAFEESFLKPSVLKSLLEKLCSLPMMLLVRGYLYMFYDEVALKRRKKLAIPKYSSILHSSCFRLFKSLVSGICVLWKWFFSFYFLHLL